jgi:hypothetical protein
MNANRNKNLILLLLISCLLAIASCSTEEQAEMIEISLDKSTLTLVLGNTETLIATSNSNQIEWISSNTDVVTVSNGVVTAVGLGDAIVNAKVGNSRAFCEISVIETPVNVSSVTITEAEVIMTVGNIKKLAAVVEPENATYKNVRWSSSNPQIVFVDDYTGEITAKALGEATITVRTVDGGKTASAVVKVWPALNLNRPHNNTPLVLNPIDGNEVTSFSWFPFEGTTIYVLKLSLSEDFSTPIYEKEVNGSSFDVPSSVLNELIYKIPGETVNVYWTVEPKDPIQVIGEVRSLSVKPDRNEYLKLQIATAVNLSVTQGAGAYQYKIVAGSGTSSINTAPLTVSLDPKSVMASIMTMNSTLQSNMSLTLIKADGTVVGTVTSPTANSTSTWVETTTNTQSLLEGTSWGEPGDYLRLDFTGSGQLDLNAIHIRPMNYQEIKDSYVPQILQFVSKSGHTTLETIAPYHYKLRTSGTDPNATTDKLLAKLPEGACILEFEYKSTSQMGNNLQIYFASPGLGLAEGRSIKFGTVPAALQWTTYRADITRAIAEFSWGGVDSYFRMDIGERADYEIEIRNMKIVFKD